MEAKELRIGNWINGNHNGFSKDVVIYDFDRNDIQHTDKNQRPIPIDYFKPIQLTEEWLLEAGFENGIIDYTLDANGFLICFINLNCYVEGMGINIKYVHQLQNLYFALTGEELNFKDNE